MPPEHGDGTPAAPGEPATQIPAAGAAASNSYPIHGSLTSAWRGRFSGGDHDNDLTEALSLDFGDPAHDDWTGHVMTRLNADLDGGQNDGTSRFHDLNDVDGNVFAAHLYDAWAERRNLGPLDHLRLGRQTLWDTPVFAWFDGASAATPPAGSRALQLGLYGGVPVRIYDSVSRGDVLAGAYAEARPWQDARGRLDWMHFEDEEGPGSHTDDLWRASGWQAFGKRLHADGWFTGLDGEERDWFARATWSDPGTDFTLSASWFELLKTQRDLSPEIDPFFTTLFELFPYWQARLQASKGIGEHVRVEAGADIRRVDDSGDVGRFNRDTERVFATLAFTDVTPAHVDVSVTGESWNGDGSDIRTWGLDLAHRFGHDLRASVGSYFSLYKVDSFLVDERDHVRTTYFRLRWHRTPHTSWDLRYELEDAAGDTYQLVRGGLTWSF